MNYVALEAGSMGRIVLASDIPGLREILRDGVTGFLLNLDSESFAEMIAKMYNLKLADGSQFAQLGNNAKEFIKDKFSSKRIYEQLNKMLYS